MRLIGEAVRAAMSTRPAWPILNAFAASLMRRICTNWRGVTPTATANARSMLRQLVPS
jgi:hypothetical protein